MPSLGPKVAMYDGTKHEKRLKKTIMSAESCERVRTRYARRARKDEHGGRARR